MSRSQRDVEVRDSPIRVTASLPRDLQERSWFLRRSTDSGYGVRTVVRVFDSRAGNAQPLTGATQETRRLRQQLDGHCLGTYPVDNDTSSTESRCLSKATATLAVARTGSNLAGRRVAVFLRAPTGWPGLLQNAVSLIECSHNISWCASTTDRKRR